MSTVSSRRTSNETSSRHLPEELIEDILVNLPVKSIIRFQSVCKSWFYLIKSSGFINKHQIESKESFLAMCYIVGEKPEGDSQFLAVRLHDADDEIPAARFHEGVINIYDTTKQAADYTLLAGASYRAPVVSRLRHDNWRVMGNCNGILCLTDYKRIMLVNPSSKEVKTLPNPILPVEGNPRSCAFIGFGFDNTIMDFKVVRILGCLRVGVYVPVSVEVYNLRSNSWRELNMDVIPSTVVGKNLAKCSTFFNGIVHWCALTESSSGTWGILAFNVANESFGVMEFPQDWNKGKSVRSRQCIGLSVLNQESFVFLSCSRPYFGEFVNIWTLNKHGINEETSWTKLYSIGPLNQFLKPMCFWKKHKFLYKTTTGKLMSYDILNHSNYVVYDDPSHLWTSYDPTEVCLELGLYKSSLFSIDI